MKLSTENIPISYLSEARYNQMVEGSNSESLKKVGEEFEAIFLTNMLKQVRDSKLSDGLFDSKAQDTYLSLLDQETARRIASKIDLGIADAISRTYEKDI